MNSLEKVLIVYCTAVSLFCIALMIFMFKLENAVIELNKNQDTLNENIESFKDFDLNMWKEQVKINKEVLGIKYETY